MTFIADFNNKDFAWWVWLIMWIVLVALIVFCSIRWVGLSRLTTTECGKGRYCTYN